MKEEVADGSHSALEVTLRGGVDMNGELVDIISETRLRSCAGRRADSVATTSSGNPFSKDPETVFPWSVWPCKRGEGLPSEKANVLDAHPTFLAAASWPDALSWRADWRLCSFPAVSVALRYEKASIRSPLTQSLRL